MIYVQDSVKTKTRKSKKRKWNARKSFTEKEESFKMWRYFQNRRKCNLLGSMIGGKRKESRYNVNHRSKARERKKHTKNAWCLVIVLWYTRTIVSRAQGEIGSFPLGVLFDSDSDNNSNTKLLNKLGSVDSWHRSPSQTCSFLVFQRISSVRIPTSKGHM